MNDGFLVLPLSVIVYIIYYYAVCGAPARLLSPPFISYSVHGILLTMSGHSKYCPRLRSVVL